ncbi:S66 peptidase family protein [Hymenobacter cellulosivorans]|uniref:LD-carboxypeptidase n=1 Tax=Hymenobacter cellulosivorans TaxID=2932249 RepID=A0ABY4F9X7_9BACT|nr:LD-carboxypeptidase [Hymenobacter cellulosivorans]UOQ53469.1 LD-carboxypeptidase [Hymenobacter cellulosivorans]
MPITSPFLRPHDRVAIVSTARKVSAEDVAAAVEILRSWQLEVVLGESITAVHHQFAGPDELRRRDLQQQLDAPDIRAIFCARGGYGTTRIIDQLDFSAFTEHPKWIAGFSDITTLNCHLLKLGYESIHGVMPFIFAQPGGEEALESLRRALFGEPQSYAVPPHPLNQPGTAAGELMGGNLTLLQNLTGTASDCPTAGRILFVEDVAEYLMNIDRMMVHLDRTGKLRNLAGLLVGHFTDSQDNAVPFGQTAYEIIATYAAKYDFPVAYGFPVGHEPQNIALICGHQARLTVTSQGAELHYL